jgi:hypothetical protein
MFKVCEIFYEFNWLVYPFCKQNDQEKGFITFETFPQKIPFDWQKTKFIKKYLAFLQNWIPFIKINNIYAWMVIKGCATCYKGQITFNHIIYRFLQT